MSICELCGKTTNLLETTIEGALIRACSECAKHGAIKQTPLTYQHKPKSEIQYSLTSEFAQLLRTARKQRNLTQEKFAELLKEKASLVAKWEVQFLKIKT